MARGKKETSDLPATEPPASAEQEQRPGAGRQLRAREKKEYKGLDEGTAFEADEPKKGKKRGRALKEPKKGAASAGPLRPTKKIIPKLKPFDPPAAQHQLLTWRYALALRPDDAIVHQLVNLIPEGSNVASALETLAPALTQRSQLDVGMQPDVLTQSRPQPTEAEGRACTPAADQRSVCEDGVGTCSPVPSVPQPSEARVDVYTPGLASTAGVSMDTQEPATSLPPQEEVGTSTPVHEKDGEMEVDIPVQETSIPSEVDAEACTPVYENALSSEAGIETCSPGEGKAAPAEVGVEGSTSRPAEGLASEAGDAASRPLPDGALAPDAGDEACTPAREAAVQSESGVDTSTPGQEQAFSCDARVEVFAPLAEDATPSAEVGGYDEMPEGAVSRVEANEPEGEKAEASDAAVEGYTSVPEHIVVGLDEYTPVEEKAATSEAGVEAYTDVSETAIPCMSSEGAYKSANSFHTELDKASATSQAGGGVLGEVAGDTGRVTAPSSLKSLCGVSEQAQALHNSPAASEAPSTLAPSHPFKPIAPPRPQPSGSLKVGEVATGYIMQIHFFVNSFADLLGLNPTDQDGPPGFGLKEIDECLLNGDLPTTHRLHISLLTFLARASLMHLGEASEIDIEGADASEFTHLDPELSRQLLDAVKMHGAWPELLRRVAISLRSPDASTLKALYFGDYNQIDACSRARLLALLCDGVLGTAAVRKAIDARMERLDAQDWDWEAAATAGLVQQRPLHHLPRVEPLGRDREHHAYWCGPPMLLVRQRVYHPVDDAEMQRSAGGGMVLRLSKEPSQFDLYEGDATLQALQASCDPRGAREMAMGNALNNFLTFSFTKAAKKNEAHASTHLNHYVNWPPLHKEILQPTVQCSSCGKRIKGFPTDFVEHVFKCSMAHGLKSFTPLQRIAVHILALELQLPPPFMRLSWADERRAWRQAVIRTASETADVRQLALLLGKMESNINQILYNPSWAPRDVEQQLKVDGPAVEGAVVKDASTPGTAAQSFIDKGAVDSAPENSMHLDEPIAQPVATPMAEAPVAGATTKEGPDVEEVSDQTSAVGGKTDGVSGLSAAATEGASEPEVVQTSEGETLELVHSSRAASGYKGVFLLKRGFEAQVRGTSLGVFHTAREAAITYALAMRKNGGAPAVAAPSACPLVAVRLHVKPPLKSATNATGARILLNLSLVSPPSANGTKSKLARPSSTCSPSKSTRSKKGKADKPVKPSPTPKKKFGRGRPRRSVVVEPDPPSEEESDEGIACEVCRGDEDASNMLLCDSCDKGYHIFCLPRPMLEVPDGDWFCQKCSNKAAEASNLAYRVGDQVRCMDPAGEWGSGLVDSISAEAVLVHYMGRSTLNEEWVPHKAERVQVPEELEGLMFDDEDDSQVCEVCGSADDSEKLLLCDTEGCDTAWHLDCLSVPLDAVPAGDWFCERCHERAIAGGELKAAHGLLVDNMSRWRCRLGSVRCCAQLSLSVGALERALRLEELGQAGSRVRKFKHRPQVLEASRPTVMDRRVGSDGFLELLATDEGRNDTCSLVIPQDAKPGDKIVCTVSFGSVSIVVPEGAVPGQVVQASVPPRSDAALRKTSRWMGLVAFESVAHMSKLLHFELQVDREMRREERDREEIKGVVNSLICQLEKWEQRHIQMMQFQQERSQRQELELERARERKNRRTSEGLTSVPGYQPQTPAQCGSQNQLLRLSASSSLPKTPVHYPQTPQQDPLINRYAVATQYGSGYSNYAPLTTATHMGSTPHAGQTQLHSRYLPQQQLQLLQQQQQQQAQQLAEQLAQQQVRQQAQAQQHIQRQQARPPAWRQQQLNLQQAQQAALQAQQIQRQQLLQGTQRLQSGAQQQQQQHQQHQLNVLRQKEVSAHQQQQFQWSHEQQRQTLQQEQERSPHVHGPSDLWYDSPRCSQQNMGLSDLYLELTQQHQQGVPRAHNSLAPDHCMAQGLMRDDLLASQEHSEAPWGCAASGAMPPADLLAATQPKRSDGRDGSLRERRPAVLEQNEIKAVVDRLLSKTERAAMLEERHMEKQREREAQARKRSRLKEEQSTEKEVRKVVESLVRRVEKMAQERSVARPAVSLEDDGSPYIETSKNIKTMRGRRVQVHRVRGMACKRWFDVKRDSLLRSNDLEAEVRQSIKLIRDQAASRKRPPDPPPPYQHRNKMQMTKPALRPALEWVSPDDYDGNWCILHLRQSSLSMPCTH